MSDDELQITTADMLEIVAGGGNGVEYVDVCGLIETAAKELREKDDEITRLRAELAAVPAERDALLARLAPVKDEALQKIASDKLQKLWESRLAFDAKELNSDDYASEAIAAVRPHIEAAERERCAKIAELHSYPMKTIAGTGYNNAAKAIAAAIRRGG